MTARVTLVVIIMMMMVPAAAVSDADRAPAARAAAAARAGVSLNLKPDSDGGPESPRRARAARRAALRLRSGFAEFKQCMLSSSSVF